MAGPAQARAYLALVLIVTLWGSYPATAKLALRDVPPFLLVAMRCTLASAFLLALLVRGGAASARELTPAALRAFLVLALTGIVGSTLFTYVGLYYTTAANSVLLQASTPVMVAVAARLYLGERLQPVQWLGVGASAFGVLLVVTSGRLVLLRLEELRAGDFITILSQAGWSAYTVYGKRVLATHSPALATTAAYVLGTLIILPLAAVTTPLYPAPDLGSTIAWGVVLYQAILGAIAHVWWYRAVAVVGASRSAMFMNLQPVLGILLAAVLVAEQVGLWQVVGGALVLAGVGLTTRGRTG